MLSNCPVLTYYHKTLDSNKLDKWTKYEFHDVWLYTQTGTKIDKGYENSNKAQLVIPMDKVKDKSLFTIGDIICTGAQNNITSQSDLEGKEFYNVTSVEIHEYGNSPHVYLGGN